MKNCIRERIGKKDIMAFADSLEKEFMEASGEKLSIINRAIGYPIRIAQKIEGNNLTPSIPRLSGLYADKTLIDSEKKPSVQNKHIEILGPDKAGVGCSLTYNYKTYYYRDPNNSDQINELRIPDVDYTSLPEYFDFCIKLFESMEDFKRYVYIILATNPAIVEKCWPGTGWELFEKLIGSSTSLGYTRQYLASKTQMTPTEISNYLSELESDKKITFIELAYNSLHNYKFLKGLKSVKVALESDLNSNKLPDGDELITTIQSTDIKPLEVEKSNNTFVPINGEEHNKIKQLSKLF